jgi:serine protease inhibitor
VNAVYFKAPWTAEFDPNRTRPGTFRRLNGSDVTVPLMSREGQYRVLFSADVHAAELMYGDSAFSMTLLMPANESTSLQTLAQSLTTERWNALFPQFTSARANVVMPKFRLEYDIELKQALERLGMAIAFSPFRANFTGMSNRDDLHISRVTQKAFIEVDEVGTRAAAATSVGVQPTSGPIELRFTRPFLFAIRERSSGTLLFVGRVGDPSGS